MSRIRKIALRDVAAIERRLVDAEHIADDVPYVGLENIQPGGRLVGVKTVRRGDLASAKFVFTSRHVLFGKLRPYLAKTAAPGFDGICSTDILPVLPSSGLDRSYLRWFLLSPDIIALATSRSSGANLPRLSPQALEEFEIPLPALNEQRRIAEILNKADALRAKRRDALARLDSLIQSIFLVMFGDPVTKGWPMGTVESVAADLPGSIRTGPFGSQLLHSEFTDDGIAVLGIDNAVHNEFRWAERRFISHSKYATLHRYTVRPGDVLITIMGTCGRCAVVPEDLPTAINTKHLCCITLDRERYLPTFLHAYFLMHPIARAYLAARSKGAIMVGLNMGIIKELPVPLVPLELQRSYDRMAKAARAVKDMQTRSANELDALFASLQHRAFRGEL